MALLVMADQQQQKSNATNNNSNSISVGISAFKEQTTSGAQQQEEEIAAEKKSIFHDFLGAKDAPTGSPIVLGHNSVEASPSASASLCGASSVGGRPPLSTTSDLASSERQHGDPLEGVPFYGPRGDISALEIGNRLQGSKRSNSDSAFTASTRDGMPRMAPDSLESLHLMKTLKNGGGSERPRRFNDDDAFYGMRPMRPASGSLILHPSAGNRLDANFSKWERSIPVGACMQYAPRGGQFIPFTHQVAANRFRDTNAGPSIISQAAADEGSRTGMKGPGILSTINAIEKNALGVLLSGSKPKSGTQTAEPESSTPSSQAGLGSASRQMTIFYGGQAHVFDDVHPNKADVIMALAGSNGGSWSTTYSPKPTVRPSSEVQMTPAEYEAGGQATNSQFQCELRGRLSVVGSATQVVGSGDRISTPTGGHQGSIIIAKETRSLVQSGEASASAEEEREV